MADCNLFILVFMYDSVAMKTRHTKTSSCTRGAGGDTSQLAPWEAVSQRDTQDRDSMRLKPDAPAPWEGPRRR